jgi:hypothetical protein
VCDGLLRAGVGAEILDGQLELGEPVAEPLERGLELLLEGAEVGLSQLSEGRLELAQLYVQRDAVGKAQLDRLERLQPLLDSSTGATCWQRDTPSSPVACGKTGAMAIGAGLVGTPEAAISASPPVLQATTKVRQPAARATSGRETVRRTTWPWLRTPGMSPMMSDRRHHGIVELDEPDPIVTMGRLATAVADDMWLVRTLRGQSRR